MLFCKNIVFNFLKPYMFYGILFGPKMDGSVHFTEIINVFHQFLRMK